MRLFWTPPVLTVLVAPLPGAATVAAVSGSRDALVLLGVGWMTALLATVLWLLLVVPIIVVFARSRTGTLSGTRVIVSSGMASFCLGTVFGVACVYFGLSVDQSLLAKSVFAWALIFSYVGLLGAILLMHDPFFTEGL